jgi:20S proteasome alpha/beta subunit
MSLGINATTADGMVLAADSRQSYRNQKGMARIGSDSATKIFKLNSKAGVIIAGIAFIPEEGMLRNISNFIEEFTATQQLEGMAISDIANLLNAFFKKKYQYHQQLEAVKQQVEADLKGKGCRNVKFEFKNNALTFTFLDANNRPQSGAAVVEQLTCILAGYNPDNSHNVFEIDIPGEVKEYRNSKIKGREFGVNWIGQGDVLARIVLGYDKRIGNLPLFQQAYKDLGEIAVNQQLTGLEYIIQWGTMTLQDAIDFCKLAIETTSAIQRFSDGVVNDPGDMPGVGGPIDVAVITPHNGFVWVHKKYIRLGEQVIDLETI